MTIELYEDLTGTVVTEQQEALYEAYIAKTMLILESMLGYTLDPNLVNENYYDETGKSQNECSCSSTGLLDDPDAIVGAYRLYRYDETEPYVLLDPYTAIHAVKLVRDDVTIKTFDPDDYRAVTTAGNLTKYIEICRDCLCVCECHNCLQLAVDADWQFALDGSVGDYPNDLLLVWAELITYEADCKKDVKSETIGAHSYTKDKSKDPIEYDWVRAILLKYAGAFGTIIKKVA